MPVIDLEYFYNSIFPNGAERTLKKNLADGRNALVLISKLAENRETPLIIPLSAWFFFAASIVAGKIAVVMPRSDVCERLKRRLELKALDCVLNGLLYREKVEDLAAKIPTKALKQEFIEYADKLSLPNIKFVLQIGIDHRIGQQRFICG